MAESCFSGATLVEDNRVIAMYHGTKVGNMIAISNDPLLLNWDKLTGKPVIPILQPDGKEWPYRVFDPCIWKKNGTYFSLSAGTLPHAPTGKRTRANFLFKSNDLINWEYLHPFVEGDRFTLGELDGSDSFRVNSIAEFVGQDGSAIREVGSQVLSLIHI